MAIKIYSDKTNKYYASVEEAAKAEVALKEQEDRERALAERKAAELKAKKEQEAAERKVCAEKVEVARKAYLEAQKAYRTELEAFCKKYGTYHYTVENTDEVPSLFDVFKSVFTW